MRVVKVAEDTTLNGHVQSGVLTPLFIRRSLETNFRVSQSGGGTSI